MIFDYNESNTILSLVFLMIIFYEKEIYLIQILVSFFYNIYHRNRII